MRCVEVMRTLGAVAILSISGAVSAVANPLSNILNLEGNLSGGATPEKFLYFSGFDLWREGGSSYGGVQWAPGGLNNDGFTLKLLLAGGQYLYTAGTTNITGTNFLGAALPGWRIKRGNFEIRSSPASISSITSCRRSIRTTRCVAPTPDCASVRICGGSRHTS